MLAVDKKGASYSIPLRSSYNCTVMAFRRYDGVIKKTARDMVSRCRFSRGHDSTGCSKIVGRRLLLKKLVADQMDDIPDSEVSSEIKAHIFPSRLKFSC